jgi:hypothetical protein
MLYWIHLLLFTTFIFSESTTLAYEVDNFTDRDKIKLDSLSKLDEITNNILSKATTGVRKERGKECNVVFLRQEILRWIRPDPAGQLEIWLEVTDKIDRTHVGLSKSIYQDITFADSPILAIVGIGRSILLNGHIVGTDKIGHFFMQGLSYYDLVKDGKPLEKVLVEDHHEDGVWGMATSGVKSYSDMAANYQGYRFWSELTAGANPYIRCDDKQGWVNNRKFTWADYANPAWDEALNCSEFRPVIGAKVEKYLKNKGWTCPIQPEACVTIIGLDHAEYFTSPKCQQTARKILNEETNHNSVLF